MTGTIVERTQGALTFPLEHLASAAVIVSRATIVGNALLEGPRPQATAFLKLHRCEYIELHSVIIKTQIELFIRSNMKVCTNNERKRKGSNVGPAHVLYVCATVTVLSIVSFLYSIQHLGDVWYWKTNLMVYLGCPGLREAVHKHDQFRLACFQCFELRSSLRD